MRIYEEDLIAGAIILVMGISSLASPLIAMKKGYAPYYWLLACGPIGLMVIMSQAALKSAKNPEEYEQLENQANFTGAILSGIAIFIAMVPVLLAISARLHPPAAPPLVYPTPIIESKQNH
jgi:hypothetical protein